MQAAMLRSLTGGWRAPAAGDHQAACLGLFPRPSARVTLGHPTGVSNWRLKYAAIYSDLRLGNRVFSRLLCCAGFPLRVGISAPVFAVTLFAFARQEWPLAAGELTSPDTPAPRQPFNRKRGQQRGARQRCLRVRGHDGSTRQPKPFWRLDQ